MTYKTYHLTLGNDAITYTLEYELEQHAPAQEWARLMQSTTVDMLRPSFNPWHGAGSTEKRITTANRLIELIDLLNQWVPTKIETKWCAEDYQNSLNKLHIHFPELEKSEKDSDHLAQLTEYNDTIHLLESLYRNIQLEKLMVLILPSINETVPIDINDYSLFSPSVKFGDMVLHYPLIGRNAFELLKADDYDCPVEQFRPQNVISPYHHLRFFDDPTDNETYDTQFKEFYNKSTIKEKYNIDDPKIAFGFIRIGNLVTTLSQENVLNIVRTCDRIISWEIT